MLSSKPGIKAYLGAKAGKLRRKLDSLAGSGGKGVEKVGEKVGISVPKVVKPKESTVPHNVPDKWSREPKSIQDQMALDAAKRGAGDELDIKLNDPKYVGMKKMEYRVKSETGKDSVIHYVRDPKTGELMDFKFKKHSLD